MKELLQKAYAQKEEIIRARRRIHSLAEWGCELPKTKDFVKQALQNYGYKPKSCGACGLTAELCGVSDTAPVILLRADMDALPMREETRLPFRAEGGGMHACGHDMHTAMLFGAARLLKEYEGNLPFRIRFAFEGGEETLRGARDMLSHGVLTDVAAAVMLHVIPALPLPTGRVLLPSAGVGAPAATFFRAETRGLAAHVGERERGEDALLSAVRLYERIRKESEAAGVFLSVGTLHAGDAPNIVPAHATLAGSFRAWEEERVTRFRDTISEIAGEMGARLSFLGDCPPLKNDGRVREILEKTLPTMGFSTLTPTEGRGNAAEDFAHFAAHVPAICLGLAAGERARGYEHSLHHPAVLFDEEALPIGAALYAACALSLGAQLHTFTNPPIA